MRFAPVAPVTALPYLPRTDYHLVLSNEALRNSAVVSWYGKARKRGETVILDHPVHERLPIPSLESILALCDAMRPTFTIVPDVIGDSSKTISQFKLLAPLIASTGTYPMAVVQGKNWDEYWHAMYELAKLADYIAVPLIRVYEQISRAYFIEKLSEDGFFREHPYTQIHLLGEQDSFTDTRKLKHHPNVMGVDSAKPVYLAAKGYEFPAKRSDHWGRPANYFDLPESYFFANSELVEYNIRAAMEIADYHPLPTLKEEIGDSGPVRRYFRHRTDFDRSNVP